MALSTSTAWFNNNAWGGASSNFVPVLNHQNQQDDSDNFKYFQINHDDSSSASGADDGFLPPGYDQRPGYVDQDNAFQTFRDSHYRPLPPARNQQHHYHHPQHHHHHQPKKSQSQSPRQRPPQSTMSGFLPYLLTLGVLGGHQRPDGGFFGAFGAEQARPQVKPVLPPETTGPFRTVYQWKQVDFVFDSAADRASAIANDDFVPENNLPLGVEVYKDRMFISMPKWKNGVPVTLAVIPKVPKEPSPPLVPYPSWDWQSTSDCNLLVSVYRMHADICGRLWVLDSGQVNVTILPKQICPPKMMVFDLKTDKLVAKYVMPEAFIKQDGLFSNIIVDVQKDKCSDAYAYMTDVWRFGLVVYSLKMNKGWRVYDHLFYPEPLAAAYNLHGLEFEWTDGIFGMALGPPDKDTGDRIMYFHPMSSFRELYTHTRIIRNETGWESYKNAFQVMGESRGKSGHTSASGMDRNGILFFNMVTRDQVGCWDSRKPYKRVNLGVVAKSNVTIVFPNDLKIDHEDRQSVWMLSNRLPYYLYAKLDPKEVNFRVMTAFTDEAIRGTICDPHVQGPGTFVPHPDGDDCY